MSRRLRGLWGRHGTTLALVVLAASAGAWLALCERGRPTTSEVEARRERLLPVWRSDEIERVEVRRANGAYTIVRDEDRPPTDGVAAYRLERQGARTDGDPQSIDALLGSLELATVRRRVPAGSIDRAAMGLDGSTTGLTLTMGDVTTKVLLGGKAAAPAEGVYAEVEGQGVSVISATLAANLTPAMDQLRERTVIPLPSSRVERLTLEGDGGRRVLVRAPWPAPGGAAFRLDDQLGPRVSPRFLGAVLEALGAARAESFLAAEADVGSPRVTVEMVPREGPTVVVALGAPCPEHADQIVLERRAPTRLATCTAAAVLGPLLRDRTDLTDHRLFAATRDELVEIKLSHGEHVLEMARRGAGFFVRSPAEREVDEEAVRGFLDALLHAEGTLEAPAGARLEGSGGVDVRVVSRPAAAGDPERIEVVRIGPSQDGRRWVRREEDGATLVVTDASVRALLTPELVLRDRHVIDVPPETLRAVAVTSEPFRQRVRRSGLGVELVTPRGTGLRADQAWGLALLEGVARLSAVRWVAPADDGSFGLNPARTTLEVDIETKLGEPKSERHVTLSLGTPTDDGTYAAIVGEPGVFLAPPELEENARRWLVDRGAFSVEPKDVARLVLRAPAGEGRPEASFALERREGALVPSGGDAERADASARAARVREGLVDLTAIAAVSVGPARAEEGVGTPALELEVKLASGASFRVALGATDTRQGAAVQYARRSDVDATYVVGASGVRALLEALR